MRRTAALVVALPFALAAGTVLPGPHATSGSATAALEAPAAAAPAAPEPARPAAPAPDSRPSGPSEHGPAAAPGDGDAAPDAEGTVDTEARPSDAAGPSPVPVEPADRGPVEASFVVAAVPEVGAVAGSGARWRYTIEVEPGLDVDVEDLADEVRAALTDERSWARTRTLEQVDDPARARIRVVLASPATVDELCGRAGLRTAGIYSCWNGRFAALNSWRWEVGADAFDDITTYRNYLVNHEFGHGLGYGHVSCPAAGQPAPVMMQQSKGVGACVANGWPYP